MKILPTDQLIDPWKMPQTSGPNILASETFLFIWASVIVSQTQFYYLGFFFAALSGDVLLSGCIACLTYLDFPTVEF